MKRLLFAALLASALLGCGKSEPTPAPAPPPAPTPAPQPTPKPVPPRPISAIFDLLNAEAQPLPDLGLTRLILLDRQNTFWRGDYTAADTDSLALRVRAAVLPGVAAAISLRPYSEVGGDLNFWHADAAAWGSFLSRMRDLSVACQKRGISEVDVDTEFWPGKNGAFMDPAKSWTTENDPAKRGDEFAQALLSAGPVRIGAYDYMPEATRCHGFAPFWQAVWKRATGAIYDETIYASGGPASTAFAGPLGLNALFPAVPAYAGITAARLNDAPTASDQATLRNHYAAGAKGVWLYVQPQDRFTPKARENLRLLASLGVK